VKIVTVNIPEPYLQAIDKLTGNEGLYPSRSELIRVAVRDFLIRELKNADKMSYYYKKPEKPKFDSENYVRVPKKDIERNDNGFKTFKIVRGKNGANRSELDAKNRLIDSLQRGVVNRADKNSNEFRKPK